MEEEHILDEDQAIDLRHSREKTIEDASSLERFEVGSPGAPSGCGEGDDQEIEHHRQTTEVSTESNNCVKEGTISLVMSRASYEVIPGS